MREICCVSEGRLLACFFHRCTGFLHEISMPRFPVGFLFFMFFSRALHGFHNLGLRFTAVLSGLARAEQFSLISATEQGSSVSEPSLFCAPTHGRFIGIPRGTLVIPVVYPVDKFWKLCSDYHRLSRRFLYGPNLIRNRRADRQLRIGTGGPLTFQAGSIFSMKAGCMLCGCSSLGCVPQVSKERSRLKDSS